RPALSGDLPLKSCQALQRLQLVVTQEDDAQGLIALGIHDSLIKVTPRMNSGESRPFAALRRLLDHNPDRIIIGSQRSPARFDHKGKPHLRLPKIHEEILLCLSVEGCGGIYWKISRHLARYVSHTCNGLERADIHSI